MDEYIFDRILEKIATLFVIIVIPISSIMLIALFIHLLNNGFKFEDTQQNKTEYIYVPTSIIMD